MNDRESKNSKDEPLEDLYLDVSNYGIEDNRRSWKVGKIMKTKYFRPLRWCVVLFKPVMTEIMNEGHSVQILDVDENKSLAQQCKC